MKRIHGALAAALFLASLSFAFSLPESLQGVPLPEDVNPAEIVEVPVPAPSPGTPSLEEARAGFAAITAPGSSTVSSAGSERPADSRRPGDHARTEDSAESPPSSLTAADVATTKPVSWGQVRGDLDPHRPLTVLSGSRAAGPSEIPATPLDIGTGEGEVSPEFADAPPFESLQWVYGGFHPSTNCVHASVTLSGLSFSRDGLRFSYVQDLSAWGLEYGAADALACLFVLDNDGQWVGGKFDWISSSRTTRDFKNVYSGYEGWSLSNVPNPTSAAFVIVSRDGRKRSNVLSAIWQR